MEYIDHARKLLAEVFYQDWMGSEVWEEFETMFFKESDSSYQEIAKYLELGVKRGYSIEGQCAILKQILKFEHGYSNESGNKKKE